MTSAANRGAPPGTSMNRQAIGSSAGRAPGSRMGLATAAQGAGGGEARPMTSISGAGYQGSRDQKAFDPLNQGVNRGPAPPLLQKSENSHEDKAKEMEKGVHRLIEASAEAVAQKNLQLALDKAKEAGKSERALCKFREGHGLSEQINVDLTYAICLTLANAYYHNKMYDDALNTYQLIVKNKNYPHAGRLRVNIGNIYYDQKKYPQAIKMYRMALDQIPISGKKFLAASLSMFKSLLFTVVHFAAKELRFRILRNIGNAFVRLGQFQDAIDSYELVMAGSADHHTAFNLLLCLYARGDKDKTKKHYSKMISVPIQGMTEEDEERLQRVEILINERVDMLKEELGKRYESANEKILTAARLIAPIIEENDDWVSGYKWVMETLRVDHEATASKLEIDLAMAYMQKRRFEDAIDVLKGFERKEPSLRAMAATNLSFIYFLEGDLQQAEKYADVAIKADRYNAKALVNKGNCFYCGGDFGRAKEMYLEAVGVEANCVEAIFNLGLANIKVNAIQEAHHAFDKLHTILPSAPEALFQLGTIYERSGDPADLEQATKTYEMLLNKVPGDPNLCSRIAQVYERLDDENAACHWQTEAHRHFPVNLNVISWYYRLGLIGFRTFFNYCCLQVGCVVRQA
jgi:intraflagellar transport protein 88